MDTMIKYLLHKTTTTCTLQLLLLDGMNTMSIHKHTYYRYKRTRYIFLQIQQRSTAPVSTSLWMYAERLTCVVPLVGRDR